MAKSENIQKLCTEPKEPRGSGTEVGQLRGCSFLASLSMSVEN